MTISGGTSGEGVPAIAVRLAANSEWRHDRKPNPPSPLAEKRVLKQKSRPDHAGANADLWAYRRRTVALLRRYMRLSIEVGRLPSLLGREFFRSQVTSYRAHSFEDVVIFVHDIEGSLDELQNADQTLIGLITLREYSQEEAARLIGCSRRTIVRDYSEALDRVSEIFLKRDILVPFPVCPQHHLETCQGPLLGKVRISDSHQGK
jgi:predicted DNA-binding protein (UPF0251 family)